MLDTRQYGNFLKQKGYTFYSGVPCSFLKDLINYAINECEYVMAANEGDAAAICAGASLAGKKNVLLMQNSGLGNAVSPLTSLNKVFDIPVLGFVSLRGEQGIPDEPQHELMGRITEAMLATMEIDWDYLSADFEEAQKQLEKADDYINANKSFFFVVRKNTFSKVLLNKNNEPNAGLPKRGELIETVLNTCAGDTAFIATTGFTGRELSQIKDGANNFYMVGSLGCASSLALGLSLAKPSQKVVVFDGDSALLMRMGALAVNAYYAPKNFCHIVFDNQAHESTGGQFNVSCNMDYEGLAKSCGYKTVKTVATKDELQSLLADWNANGGMMFIHAKIAQGTLENLERPKTKPREVAKRFSTYIQGK
ncbi:phosphonopyruvate decarboxylase [Ereboglobus luteus]|uniref:Phosphonopyruvate decarboxylase n=1 Tax=Ereboglobus luteus TaxID=1796921 RepID=A0A2U8E5H0_9BACT|nr:phosphonopyruvate decarboxylase [Ereboglobus luteus]AWI10178.1 phosphonopyruvate decarboxylase [Ereboglobus luteus]